jgi:hypothetical protein
VEKYRLWLYYLARVVAKPVPNDSKNSVVLLLFQNNKVVARIAGPTDSTMMSQSSHSRRLSSFQSEFLMSLSNISYVIFLNENAGINCIFMEPNRHRYLFTYRPFLIFLCRYSFTL